jgi:CDP-6-deoxy-D-xylo-4-hexulose-3-dehydrase
MPLIQLGLIPVPVDINKNTLNVGSSSFQKTLAQHPDIKAFFISNILGFCDDIDNIVTICNDRGIILIEDNCESFGSVYKGKKLGNFGIASTCSSYVGHHLSTIEGGVVSTDDSEIHSMVKMVRAHGWDRSLPPQEQKEIREKHCVDSFYDLYTFYDLGYNLRPTEITGFLGQIQMEIADEIIALREKNYLQLNDAVLKNPRLLPVSGFHMDIVSNFAYPVICKSKEDLIYYREKSISKGIEIRPIVGGNMTNQPFYRKYDLNVWALPGADFVHKYGFYLPNNPDLTEDEVSRMSDLLKN